MLEKCACCFEESIGEFMNIDVLVSTMNIENLTMYNELLKNLNIKGKSVVINQCPTKNVKIDDITESDNRIYTFHEKGLSKSRNKAIEHSTADISLFADDDMRYVDDYEKIVKEAYKKFPDADIVAFYVSSDNINNIKPRLKEGRINVFNSFKIQSVQLSIKTNIIKNKNIKFDEKFGTGAKLFMGEENIFLVDCLKSKLKIYSYPVEIARLTNRESTWFKGYDSEYFQVKGACFSRISKYFWLLLFIQFIIRKRKEYTGSITPLKALKNMMIGRRKYFECI